MEGIWLFNKPAGVTSAQFLNQIKARLAINEKVGHGGTLDKFASGLLVVAVGSKFTKELKNFTENSTKKYLAEIELGKTSSTDDPEGELTIISEKFPDANSVKKTLSKFPLNQEFAQIAPRYSARKAGGRRLSDSARANLFSLQSKTVVTIHELEFLSYKPPLVALRLGVSSGFYVRAFARDLGSNLETGGYLKNLIRTSVNNYSLEQALNLDDLEKNLKLTARFTGRVQSIGFRNFLNQQFKKLNLTGTAINNSDGSTSFIASGSLSALANLSQQALSFPPQVANCSLLWSKN